MHLLAIREMEPARIEQLLESSQKMKRATIDGSKVPQFPGRVVGMLFLEDSTRTRVSFEQAARKLGMGFSIFGMQGTSLSKGESLKDTVLTLKYERLDGLVMRHNASGAAHLAARFFDGPVINAGDGMHEHPTQALADALTIAERKGKIQGLKVAIVGDVMHSRVARSNLWLLHKLGAEVHLVGPRNLLPRHTGKLPASVHHDLLPGIEDADVVMALRLQKERMDGGLISSLGEYASLYQINARALANAKPDCIVMHPGPINRGLEVDDQTADGPNSVIVNQVENGVFVRMAVFAEAFSNGHMEQPKTKKATKK
ncbi:MAG: Aspartate carbamoyltransferase [Fimbriimonadales bacterium]|nr:Aspartate carbamoyltransferase [Fimbriimonadales bacterium]